MCHTLRSKKVITRKGHKCFGCEEYYPKGNRMRVETTLGDGRIYDLYLCRRCQEAADTYVKYGDVYYQGDLRELWSSKKR